MKVPSNIQNVNRKYIGEIKSGECFLYEGCVMLRTMEYVNSEAQAVRLSDGSMVTNLSGLFELVPSAEVVLTR